jgi:hypothetical protein
MSDPDPDPDPEVGLWRICEIDAKVNITAPTPYIFGCVANKGL